MRLNDLALFVVVFASLAVAVAFPDQCAVFNPLILYAMMLLLFLSFLRIDFRALIAPSAGAVIRLSMLAGLKLIALPAVLYGAARVLIPDYAIPVLLLSGISTGVVAPFIAILLSADLVSVLRMTIATSVLVPFSLPALVKLMAGADITIPFFMMVRLLALVIFVPMGSVIVMRRLFPGLTERILGFQFPISLLMFAIVNLGVFSKYSAFLFRYPNHLVISLGIAYGLSVIYYGTGYLVTPGRGPSERIAAGISLAIMNNVLVIVFSSRFFGPLSPILAAMYMFPFFTMIVPMRLIVGAGKVESRARSAET